MPSISEVKYPNWLAFSGTAEDCGDKILLRAGEGGSFQMAKEDVLVEDGMVCVRNNSPAEVVDKPQKRVLIGVAPSEIQGDCVVQDDCPSGCCQCIGLVRVCCGGGTRGFCFGAWGCP